MVVFGMVRNLRSSLANSPGVWRVRCRAALVGCTVQPDLGFAFSLYKLVAPLSYLHPKISPLTMVSAPILYTR